jgi:transcriptional regulator of met regulon
MWNKKYICSYSSMTDEAQLIQFVFQMLNQVKLLHWATTSYAKHKALDDLYTVLSDKSDLLVEAYVGKFKKQPLKKFTLAFELHSDASSIEKHLEAEREKLAGWNKLFAKSPELQNVVQEMMAEIDKTLYLVRLS